MEEEVLTPVIEEEELDEFSPEAIFGPLDEPEKTKTDAIH